MCKLDVHVNDATHLPVKLLVGGRELHQAARADHAGLRLRLRLGQRLRLLVAGGPLRITCGRDVF